jgi:hypothetical protein
MAGAASYLKYLEENMVARDSLSLNDVEVEGKDLNGQEVQGPKKDASLRPWMKFEITDLRNLGKGDVAREGEGLTEMEEAVLQIIMEFCLPAIFFKAKFDGEANGEQKFCNWVHPDDIAFSILAMQHYFNKWMIIAMRGYRLGRKLTEKEMDCIPRKVNDYGQSQNGLSSRRGRERYFELRHYTSELWKIKSCRDRMDDMFESYNNDRMSGSDSDSTGGRKGKRKREDGTENDEMGRHMLDDMRRLLGNDFSGR